VWGAGIKNARDLVVIRAELYNALDWRGRKVYLTFDADCVTNPDVRRALFRLYFLLATCGAEVYQLTSWDIGQGKGIDDYLVNQIRSNGQYDPRDVLAGLIKSAKPFVDSITASPLDLALCKDEWVKVQIPDLLRSQLARPLAARLGIPVDDLRELGRTVKGKAGDFIDPQPWPQPIGGDVILGEVAGLVDKHVIVDDHAKVAIALWVVLTYLIDVVDIMPILAILSPEKRCGKTMLLELLANLVRRGMPAVLLSPATVFRVIEASHPTLLIDEADGILKNSKGDDNLELRTVINSGYSRAFAFVPRCEGDDHAVRYFSTWSAKAIALIGRMPDSMADRSIRIEMKRKAKSDTTSKLRETPLNVFDELKSKIVRFVEDNSDAIRAVVPSFPSGLNDRAEDCWTPLFAIAEVAGGNWPDLSWRAAIALSADSDDSDTFNSKLLRALKEDFETNQQAHASGFQATTDICDHLNQDKEAPWHGPKYKNGMTEELLASRLRRYKIKSDRPTINNKQVRGFCWSKLEPVFDRYL
jgi:hypothetical protein